MKWADKYKEFEDKVAALSRHERKEWCAQSIATAWRIVRQEDEGRLKRELLELVEPWVSAAIALESLSEERVEKLRRLAGTAFNEWQAPGLPELLLATALFYEGDACAEAASARRIAENAYNAIYDLRVVSRLEGFASGEETDRIAGKDAACREMLASQFPPKRKESKE